MKKYGKEIQDGNVVDGDIGCWLTTETNFVSTPNMFPRDTENFLPILSIDFGIFRFVIRPRFLFSFVLAFLIRV